MQRPRSGFSRPYGSTVRGEQLELSLTLDKASVGDHLENPYEITLTAGIRDAWHGCFYQHDRLYTSDIFAQKLGFKGMLLPFSFLLHTASAVSHADDTRRVLDLGFEQAVYERPAYLGDTIRKDYHIQDLRTTSCGNHTILKVKCALLNQKNERIFSMKKSMMFMGTTSKGGTRDMRKPKSKAKAPKSLVLKQIDQQSSILNRSNALARLHDGQLILHSLARPIGTSMSMILSTMFRMTHPSLFNTKRFGTDDIIVPGGVVLSQVHACATRGLYEILYEELEHAQLLNMVHPKDVVGGISYVHSIEQMKSNPDLEVVTIQTWGIRDFDVAHELSDVELPVNLFSTEPLRRQPLDEELRKSVPELEGKIVSNCLRKLVRQSPRSETMFLL
eukprot:CAMPEP_0184485530 /NCGR_PEP_ID=MMETSP0113_2-20130426/7119_1 /TAXON_ID=91329 /ORGANISM="Norrisiella sphaerica, Strain BC52" /LENGTH=388 /DNA_ID=CAMNT_0026866999 /DNA_START=30 /DNA_END=1196 /DNA_ORIENTATION=+